MMHMSNSRHVNIKIYIVYITVFSDVLKLVSVSVKFTKMHLAASNLYRGDLYITLYRDTFTSFTCAFAEREKSVSAHPAFRH